MCDSLETLWGGRIIEKDKVVEESGFYTEMLYRTPVDDSEL